MDKIKVSIGYKILSIANDVMTVAVTMDDSIIDIVAGNADTLLIKLGRIFN